jgi:tRNA pseudouridine55 synthase
LSTHGLLLVDKPFGCTSHDVVQFVRWALRERSVGHTGTLDPMATGLLVVLVGAATGLAPWLGDDDKRYRARIVLGRATTTADADGETIEEAPCDDATLDRASAELSHIIGELDLAPPAVSAIRIEGRRAHARVRAGESVEMPLRSMRVDTATLDAIDRDAHAIEVTFAVGKGTYIRTLAVELGRRVGLPAHLGALRRLAVGGFELTDPRVADGLVAHARPGRGAPPRPGRGAVVAHAGLGGGRVEVAAWLRGRLLPLEAALRGAIVRCAEGDPRVARLALGQALSAVDLPELGGRSEGWVLGPDLLVRVAVDAVAAPGRRPAARPVRVIRHGAPPAAQGGEMP